MRSIRYFALIFLALTGTAHAWPADSQWHPAELRGAVLTDPFGDAQGSRDIVGDASFPAGYMYQDASGLYLRMRLDKNPKSGNSFSPFGWGVAMEYDGDPSSYDAIVWITGVGSTDTIALYSNTATAANNGACDNAETLVDPVSARVVAAPSSFGGDADYFIDYFVPQASLNKLAPPIVAGSVVQFVFGTSNSGTPALSWDIAGASTDGCSLAAYIGTLSDPPPGAILTDTDGDGMPDYWENQYPCLNASVNDAAADPDGDGLTNLQEFNQGTDPCDDDSDDDGIKDGADNCVFVTNADQLDTDGDGIGDVCDPDIDGDGIPNGDETLIGTDPNLRDTDGDGIDDKVEIDQGTDPLDEDTDNDGAVDGKDNCPQVKNPDQLDYDGDGVGDACETDEVPWLGGGAMGCSSAGAGVPWGMALLMLAALAAPRMRRWLAIFGLFFFTDRAWALQTERYAITPSPFGWNAVDQFDVAEPLAPSVGFFLNYAKDPVVYRLNGEIDRKVVSGRLTGDLVANIGLFPRVELGAAIPAVLYQTGEGFDPPRIGNPPPSFAFGDVRLRPRIALLTQDETDADWGLTLVPGVVLPTAKQDGLAGGDGLAYQPELVAGLRFGQWSFAANVGAVFRESERVRGLSQDDAMLYRAAAAYRMVGIPGLIWTGELLGETTTKKPFGGDAAGNPMEIVAGALYEVLPGVQLSANIGPGLTPGLGTPVVRFISGIRWAPRSDVGPFAGAPRRPGAGRELARMAGRRIELRENVHFLSGRSTINPTSLDLLDAVSKILKDNDNLEIEIVGHTDDVGSEELNQRLSVDRAKAVRRYLVGKGIAANRLSAEGRGESEPIVDNDSDANRERNRRVEFLVK